MQRVIARALARELTNEELALVSGAGSGTASESYCHLNTPQQAADDCDADFMDALTEH